MAEQQRREAELLKRIEQLEAENDALRASSGRSAGSGSGSAAGLRAVPAAGEGGAAAAAGAQGGPLSGIKVLDLTQYQNGPNATVLLGDFGAEILKVERPGGEPGRGIGVAPGASASSSSYLGPYFEGMNRGKKSCTLDLKQEGAREVLRRMVQWADVLVENFKPGQMESMGYSYEVLCEWNPAIIYAANSGFGPRGEWAARGSYDAVCQGMSGWMVSQGGGPSHPPCNSPHGIGDQVGSMYFAFCIVSALTARERFGVGQRVDCSQLGAMTQLQALGLSAALHFAKEPDHGSVGTECATACFCHYKCKDDKYLCVANAEARQWGHLCEAIGRPDLTDQFATANDRRGPGKLMHSQLQEEVFSKRTREEWLQIIPGDLTPCAPVNGMLDVTNHSQFWDNDYLVEIPYPEYEAEFGQPYKAVGCPALFSSTPPPLPSKSAPKLGEHSVATMDELGFSAGEVEQLVAQGVITAKPATEGKL
eukprot:COSAG06_NODE_675_length_13163_cov_8.046387_2_plen_479_part_00